MILHDLVKSRNSIKFVIPAKAGIPSLYRGTYRGTLFKNFKISVYMPLGL